MEEDGHQRGYEINESEGDSQIARERRGMAGAAGLTFTERVFMGPR